MKKKKPINEKTVIESFEFCKEQKSILINRDFRIRFFKHYHFNLVEEVWFKMHDSSIGMSTGKDMEQAIIYVEKDEKKKVKRYSNFKSFYNAWTDGFAKRHTNKRYFSVERLDGTPVGDPSDPSDETKEGIKGDKRREFLANIFEHNDRSEPEYMQLWLPSPKRKEHSESWLYKYKTNLLKKLNDEIIFKENKFIEIDIEQNVEKKSEGQAQSQEKYEDIKDFIQHANSAQSLILLGEVGAGKTTTLRHYLIKCLDDLKPDNPNAIIPVFIPLKRYKKYPEISSLITDSINEFIDVSSSTKETFDQDSYNFRLIFDGLDEVPYELRDEMIDSLKRALNQKNKVIISCRLKDYDDNFVNIHNYRLKELTDDQIKTHLKPFYNEDAPVVFKQKIKQEQNIHDMAKNPFLLDIMIEIMESDPEKVLPPNKGELIEKYVKIIIKKSRKDKINIPNIEKDARDIFLGLVAFYMTEQGTLTCYSDDRYVIRNEWLSIRDQLDSNDKIDSILQKAEAERLLKSSSSDGHIEFISPLIKDYFAAYYIKSIYYKGDKSIGEKVEELFEYTKWDDVISLLVGIVDKESSNNIMRLLINLDLSFAAHCFSMVNHINTKTKELFFTKHANCIKKQNLWKHTLNLIIALGKSRSEHAIEPLIQLMKNCDHHYVLNEIGNALEKIESKAKVSYLIELLDNKRNEDFLLSAVSVLGETKSEDVVIPLIELMKNCDSRNVLRRIGNALVHIESKVKVSALIKLLDNRRSEDFLSHAVFALGETKSEDIVIPLIELMKGCGNSTVLEKIGEALVKIESSVKERKLIKLLNIKERVEVLCLAIYVLGETKSEDVVIPLIELMKDCGDSNVLEEIGEALVKIESSVKERKLIKLLNIKERVEVLCIAIYILGETKSANAFEPICHLLNYTRNNKKTRPVVINIVHALQKINHEMAIGHLIKLLNERYDDNELIDIIIKTLGYIRAENSVEHIIIIMNKYENEYNRILESGIHALNKIQTVESVDYLFKLAEKMKDKNIGEYVFNNLINVLYGINPHKTIVMFIDILNKVKSKKEYDLEDLIGCFNSISAESKEAKEFLLQLLEEYMDKKDYNDNDNSIGIAIRILEILSDMNLEEFVEDIIKLLEKGNNNYCFETAMLIGNCSSEKSVDLLVDAIERNKKRSEVVCDLVYALGSTSLESAVSPLVSLMKKTKDKKVYNRIVDALSKLGAKEALIPIITILNETKLEWHHSRLIDGLGYIKSDDAVGFLIDLIKKTEDSDQMYDINRAIIFALGNIASEKSLDSLIDLLGTSDNGRVLWNAPHEISDIVSSRDGINIEEKVQKLREFYNINRSDDPHVDLRNDHIYNAIDEIKTNTGRRYLKQLKGFP